MLNSKKRFLLALASAALCLSSLTLLAQSGAQTTLAGVKLDNEITVGGTKLQLNGAGVRFIFFNKIHVTSLYVPSKVTKNEEVLRLTPKRLQIVLLRDVKGEEFGKVFTKSLENNSTREEFVKSLNDVVRVGQVFAEAKNFAKGDTIWMDYIPNTGMILSKNGKQLGETFKSPEFHVMYMKLWFGPKPADDAVRRALLGEQTTANTNVN